VATPVPIAPTGGWAISLLEAGRARHPGGWVGPDEPEWMWSPINVVLLRGHARTVLVDTGSGPLVRLWPFPGVHSDIVGALAGAGVGPADVDTVLLTHLDDDHAGGLFAAWPDGALVFPAARVVTARSGAEAAVATGLGPAAQEAGAIVGRLRTEGVLEEVEDGHEPAPGLHLREAPGHRAGHAVVEIAGDEPFTFLADALHHRLHVAHPEWDALADSDPELALATRRALLAEVAARGTRVAVAHVPGPRAFRVVERGGSHAFAWL
jgi:glyoxylase-like metal-dependent hydrolase (beta-lactamase superfamily II)